MNTYDDIMNCSRPVSKHPKMSLHDRAAQFMPFAALTGYDDQITEAARITEKKRELSDEDKLQLNENLNILSNLVYTRPEISGICFIPDAKKEGGTYEAFEGRLQHIDTVNQILILKDGRKIRFADLVEIHL
jgi:hypothetical protein